MPNGFHNDATIDILIHRHTEHGEPRFRTHKGSEKSLVSVHLEHDRGYAYAPDWSKVDLQRLVWSRGKRPSREEMDAVAADLVAKVTAVMSSNPKSVVNASTASAFLFLYDWCVVLGSYHLYARSGDDPFARIEPPVSRDEVMVKLVAQAPELAYLAQHTWVNVVVGLSHHQPGECVHDLHGADEWIATTVPLHEHPRWPQIAGTPLDSVESTGNIVLATREHAVDRGTDHIVILRRRPPRPASKTATSEAPSEAAKVPAGGAAAGAAASATDAPAPRKTMALPEREDPRLFSREQDTQTVSRL